MRLGIIARDLAHVIARQRPTEVAVEKVFVNVNPQSTLLLGQARGAAIAAAVLAELPVHEYTAGQVKQAVVGHGQGGEAAGAGDGAPPARSSGSAVGRRRRCARLRHLPRARQRRASAGSRAAGSSEYDAAAC